MTVTTRRRFLSAGLIGITAKAGRPVQGGFVHESHLRGHILRDRRNLSSPKNIRRLPVVIVGGGIAGLSAGWRLHKQGFHDFTILEMEPEAGGNSRCGENEITAYPWAAHYIPVPNKESVLVRELMEELGALQDGEWRERYLCFSPQERLFLHGRWQETIKPAIAATASDRLQFRRFSDAMRELRATGQFTVPMDHMDHPAKPSPLDQISMKDWLSQHGFDSGYLHWYVNYACRDDYGALARDTSAWAGIHYYASRENDELGPLTWPEGNGWIVRKLLAKLHPYVRTGAIVHAILGQGRKQLVCSGEDGWLADQVIFAAPTFTALYVLEDPPQVDIEYSPWLTANLTLDRLPEEKGIEPAWDNVIYDSPSLGYVIATHMGLQSRTTRSVWTYYWALAGADPAKDRRLLLAKDWNYWKEAILNDLSRAHPDIRSCVARVDIFRIGHAMARPTVGSIFSESRQRLASASGPILFANSDISGLSTFEEAQYRGVQAADRAISVQAARGGIKGKKSSADLAAPRESVVRELINGESSVTVRDQEGLRKELVTDLQN
ncbi:MAG: FAD-dependent oxidoreductase [Bryobacteraceae bacterium]